MFSSKVFWKDFRKWIYSSFKKDDEFKVKVLSLVILCVSNIFNEKSDNIVVEVLRISWIKSPTGEVRLKCGCECIVLILEAVAYITADSDGVGIVGSDVINS